MHIKGPLEKSVRYNTQNVLADLETGSSLSPGGIGTTGWPMDGSKLDSYYYSFGTKKLDGRTKTKFIELLLNEESRKKYSVHRTKSRPSKHSKNISLKKSIKSKINNKSKSKLKSKKKSAKKFKLYLMR